MKLPGSNMFLENALTGLWKAVFLRPLGVNLNQEMTPDAPISIQESRFGSIVRV